MAIVWISDCVALVSFSEGCAVSVQESVSSTAISHLIEGRESRLYYGTSVTMFYLLNVDKIKVEGRTATRRTVNNNNNNNNSNNNNNDNNNNNNNNKLLSAAPIRQGSPHKRFGSVLRRMPFLTQPTDSIGKLSPMVLVTVSVRF